MKASILIFWSICRKDRNLSCDADSHSGNITIARIVHKSHMFLSKYSYSNIKIDYGLFI